MYQSKNLPDDHDGSFSELVAMDYHLDDRRECINTSIADPEFNYQMMVTHNHGWLITNVYINRLGLNSPEPVAIFQIRNIDDVETFREATIKAFGKIEQPDPDLFINQTLDLVSNMAMECGAAPSDILNFLTYT